MLELRAIRNGDEAVIAQLHAASWRDSYRGILSDAYLDGDLVAERRTVWRGRLDNPQPGALGLLALSGSAAVGFAFAFGGADRRLGTLLDNLHVLPSRRGAGVGTRLLHELSGQLPRGALHLWVYAQNTRARAYYERLGARELEQDSADTPEGGKVAACLYAWPDVALLHRLTRPKA